MFVFADTAYEFGCPILDALQSLNVRVIGAQKKTTSIVNAR